MSPARFNRLCLLATFLWLMVGVPLSVKFRPIYHDYSQFYMGGRLAREGAWDSLYPVPRPESQHNPGLADDSSLRPRYEQIAQSLGIAGHPRFMQAPPNALLYWPLGLLPYRAGFWLWVLVSCACGWGLALLAGRFYAAAAGCSPHASYAVGVVTLLVGGSHLLYHAIRKANLESIVAFLLALAIWELLRPLRPRGGPREALWLGLGAGIKYASAILLPLELAMKRWRTLAWLAGLSLAALLVSLAVQGAGPWTTYLTEILPRLDRPYDWNANQSIHGLLIRLCGRSIPQAEPWMLTAWWLGLAVLAGILWLIFRQPRQAWHQPPRVLAAAAALIAWLLIFSPLTWDVYHLFLASLWGWLIWEGRQGWGRAVLVALAIAATWTVLGLSGYEPLISRMLISAVLILGLSIWRLCRQTVEAPAEAAASEWSGQPSRSCQQPASGL